MPRLPKYNEKRGRWVGGEKDRLYAFTDPRTGRTLVRPVHTTGGIGPVAIVRPAKRSEAERDDAAGGWQNPLHKGWKVELGSSSNKHRHDAVGYARSAQSFARNAVKMARKNSCDSALTQFYQAQQSFGASTAELHHIEGRIGVPEHGRAQRWLTVASKALRSRCLVRR